MSERRIIMFPGPTSIDPAVLRAMSRQIEPHSHPSFIAHYRNALSKLRKLLQVSGEVFLFSGSGTLSQEVGVVNFVEPGERVLCLVNGFFSARFADMVARCGGKPVVLELPYGEGFTPEQVRSALKEGGFKVVTATHVETSSGVANPIEEIGEVVREYGALFIVDVVASLGGIEVRQDKWGISVACACTQKCLGAPPGISIVSLDKYALEILEQRERPIPTFYGDLKGWLKVVRDPYNNYRSTHPISLVYALEEALKQIFAEGLRKRFKRHRVLAEAFRRAMKAIGLRILAKPGFEADTVTAVLYPNGCDIDDAVFRREVERRKVLITYGYGPLRGRSFRVGHMGSVTPNDILSTVSAIEAALRKFNYSFKYGAGVLAAQQVIEQLEH
ncbi:MAG: alanine--glyoxylate aminotransferase family protein [Candidatus Nezhaarchaeota archaeon]|nr:alanine--glyoxylate aminotransferase family protein [Candidatus Nezhaarchaeota archaeon]